jgi:hypothetical protein
VSSSSNATTSQTRTEMNIFVLSEDPVQAARDQCNKHVVKMLLESVQLLVTAFPPGTTRYKHTHFNHPCAKWVRSSLSNYEWLMKHACELCNEYTRRYGRVHRSERVIDELVGEPKLPDAGMTPFVQAMPQQYKRDDVVEAYRAYYIGEKARFARWAPRAQPPAWWPHMEIAT